MADCASDERLSATEPPPTSASSAAIGSRASMATGSSSASGIQQPPKVDTFCVRSRWWLRPLLIAVYLLFVLFAVPALVYNSIKDDGFSRDDQLILVGGLLVLAAVPMSVWHIVQHMSHFTKPVLQKHIVRILWMVPIYATNAWLGLVFFEQSFYMNCCREMYEAYVIYNFMVYLLNYLNLEMDLERTLELKRQQPHVFPLCCMRPWRMGRDFVHNCKHGILQYTVLRLFTTMIAIFCEAFDVYGESTIQYNVAYPYLTFINNLSQVTAMYCLVLFYKANREELAPMRPLPKFWCIKSVIFLSFFQSVIITILVYYGFVRNIFGATDASDADHRNLSSKLQDFLLCIEMFIAAIAHKYSFPHEPFHINIPNYTVSEGRSWFQSCWAMCDVSDVHADVSDHFGVLGSSMVRRLQGRHDYSLTRGANEEDRLLQPQQPQSSTSASGYSPRYQQDRTTDDGDDGYSNQQQQVGKSTLASAYTRRYGSTLATASAATPTAPIASTSAAARGGTHINIVATQNPILSEYSQEFGNAPRLGGQWAAADSLMNTTTSTASSDPRGHHHHHHHRHQPSSSAAPRTNNTTSSTSTTTSRSSSHRLDTFTGLTTGAEEDAGGMRKSDSAASDWLSTPTDEMAGLDVAGPEHRDLIQLRPDPRV